MAEHLSQHTIDSFAARTLVPRDLLTAARHIAACEECRRRIEEAQPLIARARSLHAGLGEAAATAALHLDYDELEGYVDGKLPGPEREAVSSHLSMCAACEEEARELAVLRDNLSTYPHVQQRATVLTTPTTTPTTPPPTPQRETLRQRLSAFLQFTPRRLGWALAALLLVSVAGVLSWRQSPPPQLAVAPGPNTNLAINAPGNAAAPKIAEGAAPGDQVPATTRQDLQNSPQSPQSAARPQPRLQAGPPSEVAAATESLLSDYQGIIRRALTTRRVEAPAALRELESRSSTLMGATDEGTGIKLLAPVGTVIRTSRPNLRWLPADGAADYQAVVLDSRFNVIAESGPLSETNWSPPRPLKHGTVYLWQVKARQGDREITSSSAAAKEARFKILSQAQELKLRRLAQGAPHLEMGLIYAHHGLFDEAEREFQATIKENRQRATAKKLIESLRRLRR